MERDDTRGAGRDLQRRTLIAGGGALGLTALFLPSIASASSGGSAYEGTQGPPSCVELTELVVQARDVSGGVEVTLTQTVNNNCLTDQFVTIRFFKQTGASLNYLSATSFNLPGINTLYPSVAVTVPAGTESGVYVSRLFVGNPPTQWAQQTSSSYAPG